MLMEKLASNTFHFQFSTAWPKFHIFNTKIQNWTTLSKSACVSGPLQSVPWELRDFEQKHVFCPSASERVYFVQLWRSKVLKVVVERSCTNTLLQIFTSIASSDNRDSLTQESYCNKFYLILCITIGCKKTQNTWSLLESSVWQNVRNVSKGDYWLDSGLACSNEARAHFGFDVGPF